MLREVVVKSEDVTANDNCGVGGFETAEYEREGCVSERNVFKRLTKAGLYSNTGHVGDGFGGEQILEREEVG